MLFNALKGFHWLLYDLTEKEHSSILPTKLGLSEVQHKNMLRVLWGLDDFRRLALCIWHGA
jgi:hypothetical protein